MQLLREQLAKNPVSYVSRDLERTLGLAPTLGYSIISNATPFAKSIMNSRADIFTVESANPLDTHELLANPESLTFLKTNHTKQILVFKNTKKIEELCQTNGLNLLNPASALANQVEEKVSQLAWLGDLAIFLPPHEILTGQNLVWQGTPFIAQFNRAHTGSGTSLIDSPEKLAELKQTYPNREVRVTQYIQGPCLTTNAIIWGKHVLLGNLSYQITGLAPFTDQPFATIGNDWALPNKILTPQQIEQANHIAESVGQKLIESGWRGLYGIDFIIDEQTNKLFLLEINARQPASTTFESVLQMSQGTDEATLTTFEAHLAALLDLPYQNQKIKPINTGAQIIKRVPLNSIAPKIILDPTLESEFKIIPYLNTKPGADLLRFQTSQSLMQNHNELNPLGAKLSKTL